MHRTGTLFDLAPDGLGFIVDEADQQVWAFLLRNLSDPPEELVWDFVSWEGRSVEFDVAGGKVRSLAVPAQQKMAAGGQP